MPFASRRSIRALTLDSCRGSKTRATRILNSFEQAKNVQENNATFNAGSVRTHVVILAVTWWIGFPLVAVSEFLPKPGSILLGLISIPALIVTTVFWCILLYRQWSLLQGHGARTTPGKAVGFGFIPFYNFYWWFVAYAGLATDTNNYLSNAKINSTRMSFGLAVTDCVLSILVCTIGLIPKIGAVLMVPSMIIGFILVLQQRNCVLAILKERTDKLQPAGAGDALQAPDLAG